MPATERLAALARKFRLRAQHAPLVVGAVALAAAQSTALRAQTARPPACVAAPGAAQPVIDVHMHAVGATRDGSPAGDTATLQAVIAELDRSHVIAVVVSSLMLPRTLQWARQDVRFVPTLAFRDTS